MLAVESAVRHLKWLGQVEMQSAEARAVSRWGAPNGCPPQSFPENSSPIFKLPKHSK